MTKQELVEELALLEDFESKAAASRALELVINTIKEQVSKGNEVNVSGLGKFFPQLQKGKSGVVPGTDKTYTTQDKMVPKFKAATSFKDVVAGK